MEYYTLARVIHVIAIVIWIGGVAMVTSVLLPSIKRFKSAEEQIKFFELVENRFARQAKITTVLTVLSGVYMLWVTDGWNRFLDVSHWWLWAMTFIWFVFTMVLDTPVAFRIVDTNRFGSVCRSIIRNDKFKIAERL